MDYSINIEDMRNGQEAEGFYILGNPSVKTTSAGKPFLSGTVSDRTGSIELKVWDYSGPLGSQDAGSVVKVRGEVSEYRGSLQFTANRIRLATEGDIYDVKGLVPVAPIDTEKTFAEIKALVASLTDSDYRRICEVFLTRHEKSLKSIPAAKSVHHSFLSGLLMHTACMLRAADFYAGIYSDIIDRSLLITGTLLHDLAKEREFSFSDLGTVTDYSLSGQLVGHLVMGAQEASSVATELGVPEEKALLLQHLILSHHGEPDFGAAVRPACAEAELLSYIDLVDSRMEIYRETLTDVPAGEFSGRVFALDRKIYHHN